MGCLKTTVIGYVHLLLKRILDSFIRFPNHLPAHLCPDFDHVLPQLYSIPLSPFVLLFSYISCPFLYLGFGKLFCTSGPWHQTFPLPRRFSSSLFANRGLWRIFPAHSVSRSPHPIILSHITLLPSYTAVTMIVCILFIYFFKSASSLEFKHLKFKDNFLFYLLLYLRSLEQCL